jgi:spore coat protein U-like protein
MQAGMIRLLPSIALLAGFGATGVSAQTCTITRAGPAFGTVDVLLGAQVDATSAVSVRCTGTANRTVRVCLNMGDPNGGTIGGPRIMRSGVNNLNYQIYSDAARTVKWSSWVGGGAGVEVLVPTGTTGSNGATINLTMYGRVFGSQQTARTGAYSASFSGALTHYARAYTTAGTLCPAMTAGTLRWNFTTSATVPAKCTVGNATLDFGNHANLTTIKDASANLSVACSNTLPFQIQLNGGLSGATNPTLRRMTKAAEFITYGLYRDAARVQPWGDTLGTNTYSGTGTGLSVAIPVYGRVPVQATPTPGTYTDTVAVTVVY